jgi:hypothetical protein
MTRGLTILCVLASLFVAAPAAMATTQTARLGNVRASFTFKGGYPNFTGETLAISRAGSVIYNKPVVSTICEMACAPGSPSGKPSSVRVLDLEHNRQPDVVLALYSGGAHCCAIDQLFSFDPRRTTYVKTQRNFGDYGVEIVDLAHNGRDEFATADDSFAYEFTDYAASGLPIQILTFSNRHFRDVTRSYPRLVARDAARWLGAFKSMSKQHYQDSVGVIAAWAADEDLLGRTKFVARYLAEQQRAGHLNSLSPGEPGGKKFIASLQRFLRRHGYLR